jgi:predicted acyltransferase
MAQNSTAPSSRLVALDAFRGLTIAFMVLVNDAGDGRHTYWPLDHAEWNGWTPTDVVFPSFVWIIGVAITLSLSKRLAAGATRSKLMWQLLRRSLIIFGLGLIVYVAPAFDGGTQRIMGVLQRLAICYFAAAAIYMTTKLRGQIIWLVGLLTAYWLLMAFAPVPGYGAGHLDVERNFAHYIDRIALGAHNYHATKTWDPEGIVSTLPAIATAIFGLLCGYLLKSEKSLRDKVMRMVLLGAALMAAGYVCNIWLPINKKLWTTSFCLFMAGLDFVLLAGFLWLVDIKGYQKLVKPLVIIGLNPITVYMLSELLSEALDITGLHHTIYNAVFVPVASPYNASLLWALAYTGLMYLAAWAMYKKGWIVRV